MSRGSVWDTFFNSLAYFGSSRCRPLHDDSAQNSSEAKVETWLLDTWAEEILETHVKDFQTVVRIFGLCLPRSFAA